LRVAVEDQPCFAGADVSEGLRNVGRVVGGAFGGGSEGGEGGLEVGVGCIAQGGFLVAAVADDVEDEKTEDDGEENVVAGLEFHNSVHWRVPIAVERL